MEHLPDDTLVEACQRGERRAFEHLLRRHHGGVYRFLSWQVGEGTLAEELLREAFLRALKETRRKQKRQFSTLLYAIARQLLRGTKKQPPTRSVESVEAGDKILAAIAGLSEEQREVFLLREYLDLPFTQIAEVVGCERELVKERMHRALTQLRKEVVLNQA